MPPQPAPNWGALIGTLLRSLWPLFVFVGGILLLQWLFHRWKLHRLAQSGIEEIDLMTGREFEEYLEALFTKLGYHVELTPYVGDYGADLVVRKDGVKTVVQVKRYKKRVGAKALGEVLRAKGNYGCSAALMVTNSFYTPQAIEEARKNGIELWDRDELVRKPLSLKEGDTKETSDQTSTLTQASPPNQIPSRAPALLTDPFGAEPPSYSNSPETIAPTQLSPATCVVCGKVVSPKVEQYCRDHQERFGGQIYCFEHQGCCPSK